MMKTINPFMFGKVVTAPYFADREKERDFLLTQIRNRQNVIIISPRRYGKTSLVINTIEHAKNEWVYVDCSLSDSEESLLEHIINNSVKNKPVEKIIKELKEYFKHVEITIDIKALQIKVIKISERGFEEVFEYISDKVVVFDEFQDVYKISKKLPKKMRSVIQHKKNSYLFLGSKRHMMEKIFKNPNSPFYNSGVVIELEMIPIDDFRKFIIGWFKKTDVKVNEKDVDKILEFTHGHPYYTQYLFHFLWDKCAAHAFTNVDELISELISYNKNFYETIYFALTNNQKKALQIIARETDLFSGEIITKYKIKSSQHLQKALGSLVKKEILDKNKTYHFTDLLFKEWVLYQTV